MNKDNNRQDNPTVHTLHGHPYADILFRPHHVSPVHPQMSMRARAAQFAPFAVLPGHSDVLEETARYTDNPDDLADDERVWLDNALAAIFDSHSRKASITYLEPDSHKSGGRIVTVSDSIISVDPVQRTVRLSNGTRIDISMIRHITPIEPLNR